MPAFLAGIGAKLIAGGVAVAILIAGALYIRHVIAVNAALQSKLDQAIADNQKNLEAFDGYKAHQDAVLRALADQHAADQLRLAGAARLKQEIAHAKPAEDGPVATVLARTLDGLRHAGGVQPGAPANPGQN
jgi:hypothetical protein